MGRRNKVKLKRNDLFIGIYILSAVLFFIISIPSWLLDILLAFNIMVALVILFNSLFAKEVLDMASFPTMLLFTTIFRISLNVSSTKMILRDGYAGHVVSVFGQFVGGGNLVIGTIIFIVLIIVQFIVINKGSERVSEVTARFTLDAMAGKQMAIDSDLNTGAITDKEAAERRKKLQQENSFFGSMDGATKYVKEMQQQVLLSQQSTLLVVLQWVCSIMECPLMMHFLHIQSLQLVMVFAHRYLHFLYLCQQVY